MHSEADIALEYALSLKWFCRINTPTIPWFLTRTGSGDRCHISRRVARAKAAGCTHFISFHVNSAKRPARGTEVIYRQDRKDLPFAQQILDATVECLRLRNRGLLRSPSPRYPRKLAVVKFPGPTALLELGFINSNDRKVIRTRGNRIIVCKQIVRVLEGLR